VWATNEFQNRVISDQRLAATISAFLSVPRHSACPPWRVTCHFKSESSPAFEQVNDHDDDGNHDQEMDQATANVAEEAEKPEHEQDSNYGPEHGVPFD
jgi:hypothetical protein